MRVIQEGYGTHITYLKYFKARKVQQHICDMRWMIARDIKHDVLHYSKQPEESAIRDKIADRQGRYAQVPITTEETRSTATRSSNNPCAKPA